MILRHPQAAAELVLAAMLRQPADEAFIGLGPDFGISDRFSGHAPLPEGGPMMAFFVHAAEVATPTLLKIVEHGTGAWIDSEMATVDDQNIDAVFEVLLDGEWVELIGNGNVMHWHRGDARVPRALASALMGLEQYLYRRVDGDIQTGPPLEELFAALMTSRSVATFGVLVEVACYQPELLEGPLAPLATCAGLILADRLYKARDHGYLRMAISQSERRRLDMWHGMDHRSKPLDQAIMPLAVADGLLVDELAAGRARWAEEPADRWRFLIAQLDPANYERVDLNSGGYGWVLHMPDDLQQEIDADQTELETRQWWLTAPYQLARWVETASAATDDEAEHLWAEVQQRLAETPPSDLFDDGVLRRADVECGTVAALLICAHDWVMQRADVAEFCRDTLIRPLKEAPPTHMFDSPEELVDHSWDGFAAIALPVLWQSQPEDRDLRQCAARLVTHRHLATVRRFFAAIQRYPSLQTDGRRLETLSLYWARFLSWLHERRHREEQQRYWPGSAPRVEDLPDLQPELEAVFLAFAHGTLDAETARLREFIEQTPEEMMPSVGDRGHRLAHAVDLAYLTAALTHVLSLPDELDREERTRRVDLASQIAWIFAGALVPDDTGEVDRSPSQEEYGLYRRLGAMTARANVDHARSIWEPILRVGTAARAWLSAFIGELWTAALLAESPPSQFAELIKEMLAFASEHETWTGWGTEELQLDLLGLSRFGYPRMEERHRQLLTALQPEWAELVGTHLRSSYSARIIIPFLARPVASDLAEASLHWLAELERQRATADVDVDQATAEMLAEMIGRDPQLMARSTDAATVLSALVARQNPMALQISAALGRTV